MLQRASSTVRRRSPSLLVHNEHSDFTPTTDAENTVSYPDLQGKLSRIGGVDGRGEELVSEVRNPCLTTGITEQHPERHSTCRQHPCDSCRGFCETQPTTPGGDYPPAFDGLQHSSSAMRSKNATLFPASLRTNRFDHEHPRLPPGRQMKFTHKWPAPSTLKHLAVSASCQSVDPPVVPILEHGQGSALPHFGRWTSAKVWLLLSNMTVFTYGTMLLLLASVTWFDAWPHADVMAVADHDVLVLITVAATLLVFSSMVGISGTMLNSRPLLAIYTLLLWPDQMTILAVGYTAYKRVTFNFDRKMYFAWSRLYTVQGRQIIQDSFSCCGFYNTLHEAAPSKRCYVRASLPGCRDAFFEFERSNLAVIWKVAFALAAIHILNMIIALLCSNHVTNRFGKGLTPPRYRLCSDDIKAESRGIGGEAGLINLDRETGEKACSTM